MMRCWRIASRHSRDSNRPLGCGTISVKLWHWNYGIVRLQVPAHIFVGVFVGQRADQPAVEIAGTEQSIANRKCEIEVSRLHEAEQWRL